MQDQEQLEFLESAVRALMEQEKKQKRIVLAYMDEDGSVTLIGMKHAKMILEKHARLTHQQ